MGKIPAILLVTVIAAATGSFEGLCLFKFASATAAAEPKPQGKRDGDKDTASNVRELKPIIANLAAPAGAWIRLEAAIVMSAPASPETDRLAADVSSDILGYLQTVTVPQIEGPEGLRRLRDDLNERAAIRSSRRISELVIETLVVQ